MSHLGKTTASELGLLKVGINIVVTTKANKLKQQYPDVLEGVGKLKYKQISLGIDPTVKPLAEHLSILRKMSKIRLQKSWT